MLLATPASPVGESRIRTAIERCERLGYEPVLGSSARARDGYLAGGDAERAADLRRAIEDPGIDAIWAIRGGYGAMRLLRLLELDALRRRPKPFIGFSDNTALHLALARAGVVSFHGPHAGFDVFPHWTESCFRRTLGRAEPPGRLPASPEGAPVTTIVGGVAEGALAGGNLALLCALCGTPYELEGAGAIVVIEDVGEPVYRIDRMLEQLALSGTLDGVAGIAFGRFTDVPARAPDRPLDAVLRAWAERLAVPAVSGIPVGHVPHSWTLPLGVRA
ncbi:MAG: S66 peptidase family protein, partial [Gemmatimonadota bacterium]